VSARRTGVQLKSAALVIELSIDNRRLADRLRGMISARSGLRVRDPEHDREPDVRITDGAVRRMHGRRVIVLTDGSGAADAWQAGAAAVLPETCDVEALNAAVRAAANGLASISDEFRALLVDDGLAVEALTEDADDVAPIAIDLTPREVQVLQLLAEGASNKAIARGLGITPHTAKFHVASIITKLDATGRTDAVARAMRLGLLMI
jgi:DNA-binding NarL/FixJ family response regulator